jgi:hypothetical protein
MAVRWPQPRVAAGSAHQPTLSDHEQDRLAVTGGGAVEKAHLAEEQRLHGLRVGEDGLQFGARQPISSMPTGRLSYIDCVKIIEMSTAATYAEFAAREAYGVSPVYERLSRAVAADEEVLELLETVPEGKRQPNLLFGVVRLLGGPVGDPAAFHDFTVAHWERIAPNLRSRATQTNEPGRCAVLLPVLEKLPQPLALLEVGASAGLGLYPDRYAYRYGDRRLGAGGPVLECELTGTEPPARLPEVAWRAGLDLNPLRVTDSDDVAWLDALIWPEHEHRRERLKAAAAIAAADPPHLIRGDLVDDLPALAAQAPAGATLVIFHTSVLYQVPDERRQAFEALVRTLPGHRISVEAPGVVPFGDLPPAPDDTLHNVVALDGVPLAWARGHGQAMSWFAG